MNDDGSLPPAPYKLEDNASTWLDKSDLVFIDPVGTGFSRAKDRETAKKFFGLRGDTENVGTFIRQYLNQSKRWTSPLYVARRATALPGPPRFPSGWWTMGWG